MKIILGKLYKFMRLKYIWSNKKSALEELSETQYIKDLIDIDESAAKAAFEKSWETRNFEIEMYWKRATYFWAFIASTFVGYFALASTDSYSKPDQFDNVDVYFLICIGLVLSVAWLLTNIGSKSWQRHWEVHVDLLEDKFTGPLYKTVYQTQTYSVSKINEIVSAVFIVVWLFLAIKYLFEKDLFHIWSQTYKPNYFVFASTATALAAIIAMLKGHGRGRFGERPIVMYRRPASYKSGKT